MIFFDIGRREESDMKNIIPKNQCGFGLIWFIACIFVAPHSASAHCDTLDGPVATEAMVALESSDVTPVLKWVKKDHENEIRELFQKTLVVRQQSKESKQLADMYFIETLIRLHRAGEGAPYTGLKPVGTVDPAVALADKAMENASVDKLTDILTRAMVKGIRERFHRVQEAKKHADESVTAGREFVDAYVIFTHYVEGLHSMIKGGETHHGH
jgi:hypothetical protein